MRRQRCILFRFIFGLVLSVLLTSQGLADPPDIPGTFWFGRFDVIGKMFQIEEANADIALAMARLDDEDMEHFSSQKSAIIKRTGYSKVYNHLSVEADRIKTTGDIGWSSAIFIAISVEGTVTNQDGEPLIGVNILVEGTNQGTTTDFEGHFVLEDISDQAILVVSYIGYETVEIPVAGRSTLDIILQSDAQLLDELVVVGYGTQKKRNLVGAVSSVELEDVAARPAADIAHSLQGAVPGLNILATSGGDPSVTPSVNIRGFNSINGGSPLILVDGIVQDISTVNPSDVKSVTVLKDAEAAATYGARGAFGVVLITTKSGKAGELQINYSNNFSLSTNTTRTDFVSDPYVYAKVIDGASQAYFNSKYIGYDEEDYKIIKKVADGEIAPYHEKQADGSYKFYYNTDWYDYFFKSYRPAEVHNISVSGGSEKLNGYFSGRIYKREKIQNIQDAMMKRYNLKYSLNFKPFDWLQLSGISKFSKLYDEQYDGTINGWGGVYGVSRWRDLFVVYPPTIDGIGVSVGRSRNGYVARVASLLSGNQWRKWEINNFTNTIRAKVTPIKQLEINFDYSSNVERNDHTYRLTPFEYLRGDELILTTGGQNQLSEYRWKNQYSALNIFGTYTQDVADNHHFKLMLGYNQEQFDSDRIVASSQGLLSREKANLALATELYEIDGSSLNWGVKGYFGRFNYDFDGKYLLEVNARYDGYSRFPEDSRYGFFPSLGAAWKLDRENFWSSAAIGDVISTLKIRASYGELGNQTVDPNTFRQLIGLGLTTWQVDGSQLPYARVPSPLPQHIGWEKVSSLNVGLDIGFLEDRFMAHFNLYQRTTSDMYLPGEPLPAVFGAPEPRRNYASLQNKGFEFNLDYNESIELFGSELFLNINANVSNFTGVITKYDNPHGLLSSFYEGEVLGEMWGFHVDGQFQSDDEAAKYQNSFDEKKDLTRVYRGILNSTGNSKWDHLKAGDPRYNDVNGDGKIDKGQETVEDHGDMMIIGNAMPQFPFGFGVNASWNHFDLSFIGQGIGKQDWYPTGPLYWGTFHRPYVAFIRKDLLEHTWDPESSNNSDNVFPQKERAYMALNGGRGLYEMNDYYLLNIGYLRLKNITIGYTLPQRFTQRAYIKKLRIYFSSENFLTWRFGNLTKYIDPEVAGNAISYSSPAGANDRSNANEGQYPMFKTYSVGIVLSL